jgi:hypothetical protein
MKDSWTKERLIDELTKQLIRIDDKPICNCTGSDGQLDISKELRQSSVWYNKKYLLRAQRAIATYCHPVPIVFVINLFDLTNRLKAELVDLVSSKGTLSYVLYSVVQRIFAAVSSNWFYESAAEEIEVVIQP